MDLTCIKLELVKKLMVFNLYYDIQGMSVNFSFKAA